jgi:thioredoxin-dependent peroxiredoxin
MKLQVNDSIKNFTLPTIDGSQFNIDSMKGKRYMLSFFRFASCPFCNLRMHELVTRFNELDKDFTIIAIFDSPLDNLQRHAEKHKAPFPILADKDNTSYKSYGIEHSLIGMFKGMFGRMPTLIKGIFKGYIPLIIKGSMTTMPADFLVDESGTIKTAFYGRDEGEHLAFEKILSFSNKK